ncbi:MAG: hypothetical protein IH609_06165 [Dehalococcoidia bacterium]|nr:hypothetical protein [Dehalococcoidia bacterium]
MANFSLPAPFEPEKTAYIHDRTNRPARPTTSNNDLVRRFAGFGLGLVFAAFMLAIAFQVRDGWENHREWVVAMSGPFYALGGIALGHLLYRKKLEAAAPALLFLVLAAVVAGSDIAADADDADMALRDALSIIGGILLAISIACAVFAVIWVELRNPTRVPPPQM